MKSSQSGSLVINGRFMGRRATGVDRFAFETVRALDALIDAGEPAVAGLRAEIVVPAALHALPNPFRHIALRASGAGAGVRWEQLGLPRAAAGSLLLNLCNCAPLFYGRQVTVLHDAAPARVPESYSREFVAWYRLMAPRIGRIARRVITVSEFSRRELCDAYRIPLSKIGVVPESGEHMLRVSAEGAATPKKTARSGVHEILHGGRPFVLAVGSLNRHKNFRLVADAARLIPDARFDIVVVGGGDARVYGAADGALPDFVKYLGYVSDEDLVALYRDAACFVYPSRYEGFGLPPVEALALDCPVIASCLPAVVEACGDAVLYTSPDDPAQLAALLERVTADSALREALRARGRERTAALTWRTTAVRLIEEISPWLM
ncbi:glycosyl transferase family 1 [Paraburkholderia eburnea]|uniref:Glycosyl transferase family 1 n=1 Tax=Paraburkholderia eburnea TaxID=1189126 RepID=A0A2S4MNL9_9BURK|nr:glycosyltransferase family 1 protein [Paraburkholderia eburnea]POR55947.1 glycosyl transferase family 1 [Paraburkholderia eburnea]PRZ27074.1 glycosyl transferase family 1 [Paraburkholderia eburnea]